jgi:hypothetical protein
MRSSPSIAPRPSRSRLILLLGVGLAMLGILAYAVQLSLGRLMAPWYMPILGTLGAVLVVVSLLEKRGVWRGVALLVVTPLAVAEWGFLYALRLPPYTGPIAVGRPFPAFETSRADGSPFTEREMAGDRNSVLVFFRGRW